MRRGRLTQRALRNTTGLVLVMALHGCGASSPELLSGRPAPPASVIAAVDWPPLPADGFVSDRAANRDDVARGYAAVSAEAQGNRVAVPIPRAVPQYAFHVDANGKRTPGIVIQAEQAGPLRTVGFKPLSGDGLLAALESEFEFLGTELGGRLGSRSP